jgi:hypothetical protein
MAGALPPARNPAGAGAAAPSSRLQTASMYERFIDADDSPRADALASPVYGRTPPPGTWGADSSDEEADYSLGGGRRHRKHRRWYERLVEFLLCRCSATPEPQSNLLLLIPLTGERGNVLSALAWALAKGPPAGQARRDPQVSARTLTAHDCSLLRAPRWLCAQMSASARGTPGC